MEIIESEVPIRILRYGLARDSAGAGPHCGGTATEMEFEVFAPDTKITARNRDRCRFAAWGLKGGSAGGPSAFIRNLGRNNEVNLGNTDILTVDPGDVIYVACGGAGGWGPNYRRIPATHDDNRLEG